MTTDRPPPDAEHAAATSPARVGLRVPADIGIATQTTRRLARELGFPDAEQAMLLTAVSELATNVIRYAGRGRCVLEPFQRASRRGPARAGLQATFTDQGSGIADLEAAMRDGHSSADSLGLGLPGVKRLMDEFQIESTPGRGTRVLIRKFLP